MGHIRDLAGRYAQEGYLCVAPDLYRGRVAANTEEAAALMQALEIDDGLETIRQAMTTAEETYQIKRFAITGYCMGGTFALRAACEIPELKAAAPFYGDIPEERVLAKLRVPTLFIAGVAFGYFVVLPAATSFLLNFNDTQFNIQVQAKEYYGFFAQTLLACGVVFQVPVAILAVTRLGIVKVSQLTSNRRYAYLACAVIAAELPGVDPVSMLLETAPLIALYELSIVLARIFGQPGKATLSEPAASES